MSYKDRNFNRKRGRSPEPAVNGFEQGAEGFLAPADVSREKVKARELRSSAWWKRKIAEGVCYYCGKKFPPSELTMDHKIPLARGGLTEKINIVPACKECNNKKKYLLPHEWEEYMETIKNS